MRFHRRGSSGESRGVFGDGPAELRKLALILYALVGPAFLVVLVVQREAGVLPWAPLAVAGLIVAGAAVLVAKPRPSGRDWIVPVGVVPAVCCGIAAIACGPRGLVYLAITTAQVTWAAVLCDAEVAIVAWVVSVGAAGAVFFASAPVGTAAFEATLFGLVSGLVGFTAFGKATELRRLHAETTVRAQRDRALVAAMPDTLARATRDGIFLDLHAPTGDALPDAASALVGRSAYSLVPEDVGARMRAAVAEAIATGEVQTVEYEVPYDEHGRRCFESRFARSGGDEITVVRRDVTARVDAERDRRLLAALVEQTRDAVIVLDDTFRVLVWSGAAEALSGFTASEVLGRRVRDVVRADALDEPLDVVVARLATAGSARFRARCQTRSGVVVATAIDIATLRAEAGEERRWLCVARDVTRELAAEHALVESEERYRSIVTAMCEGVVVQGADGHVLAANPAATRILGPALDALTGEASAASLLGDDERPLPHEASPPRVALATGEAVRDATVGVVRAPDDVVWLTVASMPLHDGGGHASGAVLTTFSDVTEHRRVAEAERHEGERQLREARLLGLEERVNEIELVTTPSGRILQANDRALDAYGYARDEIRRLEVADLRPPGARGEVGRHLAAIAAGGAARFESEHAHRDGSVFPVLVSARTFEVAGELFVHSLVRDLTEDRRLAEQLQQAERMESVGRLAGGIAHDFNNLLTVIRSTSELALDELPPESAVREDLEQIGSAAARASALTKQLLAVSRKQVLAPKRVDLGEVASHLAPMLRRVLGERVELALSVAPSLPPCLLDPGQLDQVLLNLVMNARDAMPRGGTIRIDVRAAEGPSEPHAFGAPPPPGSYAVVTIADDGEGMAPATLERIFEPFFTTKPVGKGTGLGLSMVYGIVAQSRGHLGVTSALGEGTTFRLYFPACVGDAVPESAERPTRRAAAPRSAKILVVDDEAMVRDVATRILERAGHRVVQADGGAAALACCRAERFDFVLCDVMMPGLSGPDLAARLGDTGQSPPVLFMSGYADADFDDEAQRTLAEGYLHKPFSGATLLELVTEVLERGARAREPAAPGPRGLRATPS